MDWRPRDIFFKKSLHNATTVVMALTRSANDVCYSKVRMRTVQIRFYIHVSQHYFSNLTIKLWFGNFRSQFLLYCASASNKSIGQPNHGDCAHMDLVPTSSTGRLCSRSTGKEGYVSQVLLYFSKVRSQS